MIADNEIMAVLKEAALQSLEGVLMEYREPIAPNSGHSLSVESLTSFGAITAWNSGAIEVNFLARENGEEMAVSNLQVSSASELHRRISEILRELSARGRVPNRVSGYGR